MERAQHEKVQQILDLIEQNNAREESVANEVALWDITLDCLRANLWRKHGCFMFESIAEKRERLDKYRAISKRLASYYNAERAKLNRINHNL